MNYFLRTSVVLGTLLPSLAFAQGELSDARAFFQNIMRFMDDTLIPFIFAIAFLVFLWGAFKYFIKGGDDPGAHESGRQFMLYAIIGFVLMVSIWGIVNILAGGLFPGGGEPPVLPSLPE